MILVTAENMESTAAAETSLWCLHPPKNKKIKNKLKKKRKKKKTKKRRKPQKSETEAYLNQPHKHLSPQPSQISINSSIDIPLQKNISDPTPNIQQSGSGTIKLKVATQTYNLYYDRPQEKFDGTITTFQAGLQSAH